MSGHFSVGAAVECRNGRARRGTIREVFRKRVTRMVDGRWVSCEGSSEDPVYLVELADGDEVLKRDSDLSPGPGDVDDRHDRGET